jgi:hypothetical protein
MMVTLKTVDAAKFGAVVTLLASDAQNAFARTLVHGGSDLTFCRRAAAAEREQMTPNAASVTPPPPILLQFCRRFCFLDEL